MALARRSQEYGKSVADEQISLSTGSADSLTVPANVQAAFVTASGANVRYRFAGTPTPTVGHLLSDGGNLEVFIHDLASVQFIAESGTPTIFVTYLREV